MTWAIPDWWALTLLALASFRLWRVIAEDSLTIPLRARIAKWSGPKWEARGGHGGLSEFISCPWCLGAWIATGWWLAWIWEPRWALIVATPFAISAILGLVAANIDPTD